MHSSNSDIRYISVDKDNFELAYNIQKEIWPDDPDYNNFYEKANDSTLEVTSFIVYYKDEAIGITGTYLEDIDDESIWLDWFGILPTYRCNGLGKTILLDTIKYCQNFNQYLYFRLDTTYWDKRPAIYLYDLVMDLREEYTIEDTETKKHNYLIYTYDLKKTGYIKPWNNRYLGLVNYYENL